MVVVAHAPLEAPRAAGGLDATHEAGAAQGTEHVVEGLRGYGAEAAAHGDRDVLDREMVALADDRENGQPRRGDAQPRLPQDQGIGRSARTLHGHEVSAYPVLGIGQEDDRFVLRDGRPP